MQLTSDEQQWLSQNSDKLVLCYSTDFPPIELVSKFDGEFKGLAADVFSLLEKELGVTFIKRSSNSWIEHLAAVKRGDCAVVPAIMMSASRKKYIRFTAPYARSPVVIISGNPEFEELSLAQLAGLRVAVVEGAAPEEYLPHDLDNGVNVIPMSTPVQALRAASFGQVDAYVENIAIAAYFVKQESISNLRVVGDTPYYSELRMGIGSQYPQLASAVQKALLVIPENELESARNRWMSFDIETAISRKTLIALGVFTGFVVLLTLGLFVISMILKRRLNDKVAGLHKAHQKILEQTAFLNLTAEVTQAGTWDYDVGQRASFFSRQWFAMLGYDREGEVISYEEYRTFVHPDDIARSQAEYRDYIAPRGKKLFQIEMRLRQADGGWCWVLTKGKAVSWDDNGMPSRIIGLAVKIQELKNAQEVMHKSEERFRMLFQTAPIPLSLVSRNGKTIALNDAFTQTFGYTINDIPTLNEWWQLAYPDPAYREFVYTEWTRLFLHSKKKRTQMGAQEFLVTNKQGKQSQVIFNTTVMEEQTIFSLFDITELREKEIALQESIERMRATLNASHSGILVIDKDYNVQQMNPQFLQMWRLPPEYAQCKRDEELRRYIFPLLEDPEGFESQIRHLYTTKTHQLFELQFKDGRVFECYSAPVLIGGVESGRAWDFRDITDRRMAEDKLRQSEEKFSKAFDMSPAIFAITRLNDGQFIDVNDRFGKITGWTKSEVIGATSVEIQFWKDECYRTALIDEMKANEDVLFKEVEFFSRDGTAHAGVYAARPIQVGEQTYLLSIIQDISERKRIEAERQKLQEQLFQSQKMEAVGVLAGGVAHDFNNLLGGIMGFTELALMETNCDARVGKHLNRILDIAHRSASLTRQLLAFARKEVIEPKVFNANTAIEAILKMLQRLIGENIELRWISNSQPLNVKIDPSQFDQILANLCVNARDAITGVGHVSIETKIQGVDEETNIFHPDFPIGEYVMICVSDTGSGMDKETVGHIFEPFFTTKAKGQGTGLGLSTVYGIVHQNGGFVEVSSEPGKGSTFNIFLPKYTEDVAEESISNQQILRSRGETILVVEDEIILLEMVSQMLQSLGYSVLSASTPSMALKHAREYSASIDMILSDLVMPEMSGRDLANQVAGIHPEIKHLFMSGYTAEIIAHQNIIDEGINFIHKPFSLISLSQKIASVLNEAPSIASRTIDSTNASN